MFFCPITQSFRVVWEHLTHSSSNPPGSRNDSKPRLQTINYPSKKNKITYLGSFTTRATFWANLHVKMVSRKFSSSRDNAAIMAALPFPPEIKNSKAWSVIRLFAPPTPCNLFGKVASSSKSPSETGTSMRGNETSLAALSQGTIYLTCTMNFWVFRSPNPMVWTFKWNLSGSIFTWYYLFSMTFSRLSLSVKSYGETIQMKQGHPTSIFQNICSEDDLRSRILGTFVVKFLACLPLLGFSNI